MLSTLRFAFLCSWLVGCGAQDGSVSDAFVEPDSALASADGPPMRASCSNKFGAALGTGFGRLDGYLMAIVPPGKKGCASDADHVHLQVKVGGALYDVAITAADMNGGQVDYLATSLPLQSGAWAEGWHSPASIDYPALGIHASDFQAVSRSAITNALDTELAAANHVSIFSTAYTDHSGAHRVHRNGNGDDGALIIDPLAATSRWLVFHFATQQF